ncbi:hypothetical protein H8958_003179 [Nasalis larvatus]
MAALTAEHFAALQSLLKVTVERKGHESYHPGFKALTPQELVSRVTVHYRMVPSILQLLQALHRLTRLVAFRDLSSAEAILALFPENFHQNLKNLLTKIILEHVSNNMLIVKKLGSPDKQKENKTPIIPPARGLLGEPKPRQIRIQEDPSLCGDKPSISAVTVELSKETLDTMLDGLGRIRDQLSAMASK